MLFEELMVDVKKKKVEDVDKVARRVHRRKVFFFLTSI